MTTTTVILFAALMSACTARPSDGWNGAILIALAAHSEDNDSPTFLPWDTPGIAEGSQGVVAEFKALTDEAVARGWPIHLQPTVDFVRFAVELGPREELDGKNILQYGHDSGQIFWDGRAHDSSDANAVDATYAIADAIDEHPHTHVLGSAEVITDWAGSVPGEQDSREEHYLIILSGEESGHPKDQPLEAGVQRGPELGIDADQVVVWNGDASSAARTVELGAAVHAGRLPTAVILQRFAIGAHVNPRTPYFTDDSGRDIFTVVDEILGQWTAPTTERLEIVSITELVDRWESVGGGTSYTYDAATIGG